MDTSTTPLQILLADDDVDDCLFFEQALAELAIPTHLVVVHDGEQLMQLLLKKSTQLPDILFLDLNMPCKNGFECLSAIKQDVTLKTLPVVILSTYFEQAAVDRLYAGRAHWCIQKPTEFARLKQVIERILMMLAENNLPESAKENFVLVA